MTTFEQEWIAHCEALLAVLQAAGVPYVSLPDAPHAPAAMVALRPALRALGVPRDTQRWMEARIQEEPDLYRAALIKVAALGGWQLLVVQLHPLTRFIHHGHHKACVEYAIWHTEVTCAVLRHGYYDPLTNHTPPSDQQLDALERREHGRDLLNNLMPGFGDALSGHRPSTEEGRQHVWYLRVDEEGNREFIRDCDLPDDEGADDED